MTLAVAFSTIAADRGAFVAALTQDLSRGLRVEPARISITEVRAGSVVVTCLVQAADATAPPAFVDEPRNVTDVLAVFGLALASVRGGDKHTQTKRRGCCFYYDFLYITWC